jgi:hypothetical protein
MACSNPATTGGAPPRFVYSGYEIDTERAELRCSYRLGATEFCEVLRLPALAGWSDAAHQAARLVYLLAGVSYYKTAAPGVIDLGTTPVLPGEVEFLHRFYLDGLGEFAWRNGLDLRGLRLTGGERTSGGPAGGDPGGTGPKPARTGGRRVLVPFGGGIDSIVSAELVRRQVEDVSLFVLGPAGGPFAAIEEAARASALPVLHAERALDPKVLEPATHGYLTGHVPVTGIVSAIAVLCAVLEGRDTVVMSNERSASAGNLVGEHGPVNHQWSKSAQFESAFRLVLARSIGPSLEWFSLLRPCSELWVAQRFAALECYHTAFRSCNRAFHLDPAMRLDQWCGRCDKCCFIDLVLAPFLPAARLSEVFAGREPLEDASLLAKFETLLGLSPGAKPWECVGDAEECRSAAVAAARRADRAGNPVLPALLAGLGPEAAPAGVAFDELLVAAGPHHVPEDLAVVLAPGLGDADFPAASLV